MGTEPESNEREEVAGELHSAENWEYIAEENIINNDQKEWSEAIAQHPDTDKLADDILAILQEDGSDGDEESDTGSEDSDRGPEEVS